MKNYSNIDKSGFHPGQYVGYCNGAWKVRKMDTGKWIATKDGRFRFGDTLGDLNAWFAANNGKAVQS